MIQLALLKAIAFNLIDLFNVWLNLRDIGATLSNHTRSRDEISQADIDHFENTDVRQLIEQASLERMEQRNRQNDHQYAEYQSRSGRNFSPRSRNDIQVRVNNQIPYLMDVDTKTLADRKRKTEYYEEPVRKDMKVVIHQDLSPDIIANEHPLRINLRHDGDRSRRMAELIVNEALDRDYDREARDLLIGGVYQGYNSMMPYEDVDARYESSSFERRPQPILSERSIPMREHFLRGEYIEREAERRSWVPTYDMDPIPLYDRYSSSRDVYSPDLGRAMDHYVDNRLPYDEVARRPTSTQRKGYILATPPMREGVSLLRDLEHRVMEPRMGHRSVRESPQRVVPPQRSTNNPTAKLQRPESSRARVPLKLPEPKNIAQRAESSKQPMSKRLGVTKTVHASAKEEKKEQPTAEKRSEKPMIPKFKQVIDASLKNNVAEMTPKKKADFKMQELEFLPVCTERSLNERFSSIFSRVWNSRCLLYRYDPTFYLVITLRVLFEYLCYWRLCCWFVSLWKCKITFCIEIVASKLILLFDNLFVLDPWHIWEKCQ